MSSNAVGVNSNNEVLEPENLIPEQSQSQQQITTCRTVNVLNSKCLILVNRVFHVIENHYLMCLLRNITKAKR